MDPTAEQRERFRETYGRERIGAEQSAELEVIGSDYGANGYTTLEQAGVLREALALNGGSRLLDLGSGRGWPGLFIGESTSAYTILTDNVLPGLRTASLRRTHASRAIAVVDARRIPFKDASFHGVVHTDVLC